MKSCLIMILFLVLFTKKSDAQFEIYTNLIANTDNWNTITPIVDGKYAYHKIYRDAGTRWGVDVNCWYKGYIGFSIGMQYYEFIGAYLFDAPIVGINGGGYSLVFGMMYPIHLKLRYPVFKLFNRYLYVKTGMGLIFANHRGFDFANYSDQSYIEYSNKNIRIDFDEKGNGQFQKNFFLLDWKIGLEGEIFKWMTIGIEGGYSKGFKKLGEYEVQYKITNEPLQYAKTSIDGSRFYFGFRLGLRVFKSKPKSLKK